MTHSVSKTFANIYSYSLNFHKKLPPSEITALIHIFSSAHASSVLQLFRHILSSPFSPSEITPLHFQMEMEGKTESKKKNH